MGLRIVHADRHKLFHDGLKGVFTDDPYFEIIDHCKYFDLAVASLDRNRPDILITATTLYDTRNAVRAFCDHRDQLHVSPHPRGKDCGRMVGRHT